MIQILGLRIPPNVEDGKAREVYFRNGWRAESVLDLFTRLEEHLSKIPKDKHWNLFYTLASCVEQTTDKEKGQKGRRMESQSVVAFDIDKMDTSRIQEYIDVVTPVLKVKPESLSIVESGNGLHFIIHTTKIIRRKEYFDEVRIHYKTLCKAIDKALGEAGLIGSADPKIWDHARFLRLPGTTNQKVGKEPTKCKLNKIATKPMEWVLEEVSEIPVFDDADQLDLEILKKLPDIDVETIQNECLFIRNCAMNQAECSEPEWYAMLGIIGHSKDLEAVHRLSCEHPGYTREETDTKTEQAISASRPRLCKSLSQDFGKCRDCVHRGKVKSPVQIKGPDFIATQETGFHEIKILGNGQAVQVPCYEDLLKFFDKKYKHIVEGNTCMIYNGKHFEPMSDNELKNFAQRHFRPFADDKMCTEFQKLVCRTNLQTVDWFHDTVKKKVNFQNGVLDVSNPKEPELLPHADSLGFKYVLPYDYDPTADAPRFRKFMEEVTGNDADLQRVLLEFTGYAFSGDSCWIHKSLILKGIGSNGKSVFIDVLRNLAGEKNFSSLTLSDLKNPQSRFNLQGKLFNLAEETPKRALVEGATFKNLISGGIAEVKQLYKQPHEVKNKTKFMFSCNKMPKSDDTSHGFFRRLIIVPFDQIFSDANGNKDVFILDKLLTELPGIFNMILKAYGDLVERRRLVLGDRIQKELDYYRSDIDFTRTWIKESLAITNNMDTYTGLDVMYQTYVGWCKNSGYEPLNRHDFRGTLSNVIPEHDERKQRVRESGSRTMVLMGVEFQN